MTDRSDLRPQETRSFLPETGWRRSPHLTRCITDRQLECLAWVQQGKSATDIGDILGLSSRTVEKHLKYLCEHLGVRTRLQAVLRARELGLITETRA